MPVDIRGKEYFTVAERLKLAYGEGADLPVGVQAIETAMEDHAGVVVVVATVTFQDGRRFTGMSAVKSNSNSPAERDAPVETCETSAVGRALAFAGYFGNPEGIAGAEELALAQQRAEARASQGVIPPQRTQFFPDESSSVTRMGSGAAPRPVVPGGDGPTASQVRFASKLWGESGKPLPPPDFQNMTRRDLSRLIDEMNTGPRG